MAAELPESRSDTPKGASGETRAFTAGTNDRRLSHISGQVSPGCTSVEYVRWPRPPGSSTGQSRPGMMRASRSCSKRSVKDPMVLW